VPHDFNPQPEPAAYRLCPRCFRAVPARSDEHYCINDGAWMLERCPICEARITSPYARFCASCGLEFASLAANHARDSHEGVS
jgi:hypothetical protein